MSKQQHPLRTFVRAAGRGGKRLLGKIARGAAQARVARPQEPAVLDPTLALVPMSARTSSREGMGGRIEELLHMSRAKRHVHLKWARRGILLCLLIAVFCVTAAAILQVVRVDEVRVEGMAHYTEQDILSLAGVAPGDELYARSPSDIRRALLRECGYLEDVEVTRKGRNIVITLREYTPRWVLNYRDGLAALIGEDGHVLELRQAGDVPPDTARLTMVLPPIQVEGEGGTVIWQVATLEAGKPIPGQSRALTLLGEMERVLETVQLPSAVAELDMSDIYQVRLVLADGTELLLHECRDAKESLGRALRALDGYLSAVTVSETVILQINVPDGAGTPCSIRQLPRPNVGQSGENTAE